MKSEVSAFYQVGELFGQSFHVFRHDEDVVVGPEERHGAGDLVVAVEGRQAGVPPGPVQALTAPVISRPQTQPAREDNKLIKVTSMHGKNLLKESDLTD